MYGLIAKTLSAADAINNAATQNSITKHDPTKLFIALIIALFITVVYLVYKKIKTSGNVAKERPVGKPAKGSNSGASHTPVSGGNSFDDCDGKIEIRRKNSGLLRGEIPLKQANVSFGRATEEEKAELQVRKNKFEKFIHDTLDDTIRVPFVDDASYPGYKSVSRYNFYIQYLPDDGYRLFAESPKADHVPLLPVDVNGNLISNNGVIYEQNGHLLRNGDTIRIGKDSAYILKVFLKVQPAGGSAYDSFDDGNEGTVGGTATVNPVNYENLGTHRYERNTFNDFEGNART